MPSGANGHRNQTEQIRNGQPRRPFEAREAQERSASKSDERLRNETRQLRMIQRNVIARWSARAIPVGFCDIYVLGAMAGHDIRQSRAAQKLRILLLDPSTVLLRLGFPIPI